MIIAQWANSCFFVQWVFWVYLFCQNTRPLCAHCAMLQCMSRYKPPWVAITTTHHHYQAWCHQIFFVNNTKIFVTSSVLKLQKWFLHQNGVESNQESKSDMYKLLGGVWRCVSYQKMCSRWLLAWYCHLAWLDIVAHCAVWHIPEHNQNTEDDRTTSQLSDSRLERLAAPDVVMWWDRIAPCLGVYLDWKSRRIFPDWPHHNNCTQYLRRN